MLAAITQILVQIDGAWLDTAWLYTVVQIGVLAVSLVAAYRASRHGRERLLELLSAVFFGLLLEEGDILIFRTYRYDPHWFAFDLVPPAIALSWALIISSAMNISDALGVDERVAPIADAVWALLLDLSLDAVAIRLGLWRWNIPLSADWFGVPYGNFYAWLWVAASFSFFTRRVRRRAARRGARQGLWQLGAPIPAYAGLLAGLFPYAMLQVAFFRKVGSDWILFAIALSLFVFVTVRALVSERRVPREPPDAYLGAVRYMIHLYFLWALIATGIFLQLPILLFVSLTMLTIETLVLAATVRGDPALSRRALAWAQLILHRNARE